MKLKIENVTIYIYIYIYIKVNVYIYIGLVQDCTQNKSWRQHPTRHQLYGHLPPITKTIQVRRTRHAGHCWRSRDELIRDVLLWIPTHGRAKAGRPARTYIQQLCEDTGCCPEDLPRAMNDREEWRERVRDIRATSAIWWWWWWWYIYITYYISCIHITHTHKHTRTYTHIYVYIHIKIYTYENIDILYIYLYYDRLYSICKCLSIGISTELYAHIDRYQAHIYLSIYLSLLIYGCMNVFTYFHTLIW